MKAIDILINLLKESEGCSLTAYRCPAGVLTCGWGSTGKNIKEDTVWSQDRADRMLYAQAYQSLTSALSVSPILATETDNRKASIGDFIYNLGVGAYQKSTLKKRVDSGNWDAAKIEILRWNKANGKVLSGLTIRRKKESELLSS